MINEALIRNEEMLVLRLRSLYQKYGYLPFKMSKFEEYELYLRYKDFLVSDQIITFSDTKGKLLALKPDVTLSIIKNANVSKGCKQKVYYNENVYRVSDITNNYKEIMQAGLECFGNLDLYDVFEVIILAAKSLSLVSDNFYLEISSLEILTFVLNKICVNKEFLHKAIGFIAKKNSHDLERLCKEFNVSDENTKILVSFTTIYGEREQVIKKLKETCYIEDSLLEPLWSLSKMLNNSEFSDRIVFDFSVVNDLNYYNGFVFKGFVDGIFDSVLVGGQYDKMMTKINSTAKAIGFAVYLDLLEKIQPKEDEFDFDILLIYSDETEKSLVCSKVNELIENNFSVSAQKAIPTTQRYKTLIDLTKGD